MRTMFRVAWLREDQVEPRSRNCGNSRAKAERCLAFVQGRYPDAYPGMKPYDYVCCTGYQCGCRGLTWAEKWVEMAGGLLNSDSPMRPLLWSRIEERQVTPWVPTLSQVPTTPSEPRSREETQ
jgi:hypothetical protein